MLQRPFPQQIAAFAVWLILTFAASAIGAFASINARSFYAQLTQPVWAPPGWLFGPVWSALYLMMAISAWLVWRERRLREARGAFTLFFVQLAANALWSWLFFTWHLGALAFAEILVLWVLIAATIVAFWRVRPLAGALLLPYLAWVSFASVLAFWMWRLNPVMLS